MNVEEGYDANALLRVWHLKNFWRLSFPTWHNIQISKPLNRKKEILKIFSKRKIELAMPHAIMERVLFVRQRVNICMQSAFSTIKLFRINSFFSIEEKERIEAAVLNTEMFFKRGKNPERDFHSWVEPLNLNIPPLYKNNRK